jgi:hypothetical protein
VYLEQQFRQLSRHQATQPRQHTIEGGHDDRLGSPSKVRAGVINSLRKETTEGKKHNQAIRSRRRHLCRTIYKTLTEEREYEIPYEKVLT